MKKQQADETLANGGKKVSMREIKSKLTANAVPIIDIKSADQAADNLITYREFISALKGSKDNLYHKILPRTLSL